MTTRASVEAKLLTYRRHLDRRNLTGSQTVLLDIITDLLDVADAALGDKWEVAGKDADALTTQAEKDAFLREKIDLPVFDTVEEAVAATPVIEADITIIDRPAEASVATETVVAPEAAEPAATVEEAPATDGPAETAAQAAPETAEAPAPAPETATTPETDEAPAADAKPKRARKV